jgi:hypothetical protein
MNWNLLVATHAAVTFALVGLIWLVQRVHYPLFAAIPPPQLPGYEQEHCRRIGPLVGPLMLAEAALAAALWWQAAPNQALWTWLGMLLLLVIHASTAFLQVPCHRILSQRADAATIQRLVATNWLRTTAWTLRGAVAFALLVA